ncbi:hypothetical protein C0584_04655 [Candidatus Parcubacteria bacterium]|nr:MAG: hypothetical protein C0584_04655 [Candidatus Parcubacteria bacterium]
MKMLIIGRNDEEIEHLAKELLSRSPENEVIILDSKTRVLKKVVDAPKEENRITKSDLVNAMSIGSERVSIASAIRAFGRAIEPSYLPNVLETSLCLKEQMRNSRRTILPTKKFFGKKSNRHLKRW